MINIIFDEDRVTNKIYENVISSGICEPIWLSAKGTTFMKNIKEVRVLNRHNFQGFVFEKPFQSCGELKKFDKKTAVNNFNPIYSYTHTYSITLEGY